VAQVKIYGLKEETKKRLIHALFDNLADHLEMNKNDIEICIIESIASNWRFRGLCGDEIALSYDVRV
jgi:phenylpyruvate tautomerase PptA (4-oxalocrotonate tautomerase family)